MAKLTKIFQLKSETLQPEIKSIKLKYSYIQDVPGGMDKTSGECSLC